MTVSSKLKKVRITNVLVIFISLPPIFVKARMSLSIVMPKILVLYSPRDKEVRIKQRLELLDGVVMALLAPCRG